MAGQTINQVCRRLELAGRLRRYVGSAGKIVNDLRGAEGQPASEPTTRDKVTDQTIERLAYSVGVRVTEVRLGTVVNNATLSE